MAGVTFLDRRRHEYRSDMHSTSRPPSMSREAVLALAAGIRDARAEVIAAIRSGERGYLEVLSAADPAVGRIKVVAVLENLPQLGKVAARRVLDDLGIAGDCRVRELTDAQRTALLDRLST